MFQFPGDELCTTVADVRKGSVFVLKLGALDHIVIHPSLITLLAPGAVGVTIGTAMGVEVVLLQAPS